MRKVMALAVVTGILLAGPAQAQDKKEEKPKPYRFTAFAINMGSGPKAGVIDIVIERLTTDEERQGLIAAFVEGSQNSLLKALQKVKPRVGYIRTPNSHGYDLQYAYRFTNSDGTSTPSHHVRMQAVFQRYSDSGVSKTINLPTRATPGDVADAFHLAHQLGCKGLTVFRSGSRSHQVLSCSHVQSC